MVMIARTSNRGRSFASVLKSLSRAERRRLTEEMIRVQNPGISNSALKAFVRAGVYPKRYTASAIRDGVKRQLLDALGATFSFAGSLAGGVSRRFAVGVVEAVQD